MMNHVDNLDVTVDVLFFWRNTIADRGKTESAWGLAPTAAEDILNILINILHHKSTL